MTRSARSIKEYKMKKANKSKLLYFLMVLALVLTVVIGCKETESTELAAIELVPQNANMLGNIQVNKIINDRDLIDAYDKVEKEPGQPETFEEALNTASDEIGIDWRNCTEAIIFANIAQLESEEYLAFIVEGTFDENKIIDQLEEQYDRQLATSDYKGYKLYIDEVEDLGIVFLSDKMLILGSTKAVKDAIDVSKGDRKKIGGTILDTYNRLGDVLIKFAFEFPEEVKQVFTQEQMSTEIPLPLESFSDMDMLGFALDKEGETISIEMRPHFLSLDSIQDVENTLSGLIMLVKGTSEDSEVKNLLDKIDVSINDSWLIITFEITLSEIEQLSETFRP